MSQPKVLVAYASRYGSTGEVADRIATRLREREVRVDVRPAGEIEDVDAYDAVVLGSPVFDGWWMPETADTARRLSARMSARPVWLFSVGTFGDRHPVIGGLVKREPRDIGKLVDAVKPRDYRVFAGVIDPERWSRLGGIVLRALGGRHGDNRNVALGYAIYNYGFYLFGARAPRRRGLRTDSLLPNGRGHASGADSHSPPRNLSRPVGENRARKSRLRRPVLCAHGDRHRR